MIDGGTTWGTLQISTGLSPNRVFENSNNGAAERKFQ